MQVKPISSSTGNLTAVQATTDPPTPSIDVPKVQILLIRQIAKRSRIEITSLQPALHRTLNLISPLVLSRQDEAQSQDQNDFDQVRDDHAPDPEFVARGLRGEVEEGAGDVAGAVAEEEAGWESFLLV